MLAWLKSLFSIRPLCIHQWERVCFRPTGYSTLDWAMHPTRQWERVEACVHCRQERIDGGFIVNFDKRLHPEAYNERGWPIDEDGNEMPCPPR